jgi:hypothetical protein
MDVTLVGANGKTYHFLAHERWVAERLVARYERLDSPKGILRRNGLSASILRASGAADSLVVAVLTLALLIATEVIQSDHPATIAPFVINVFVFCALAGPFAFLQSRRRVQSMRETRAYRTGVSSDGAGSVESASDNG